MAMRLCLALIIGGCASALHAPALRGPSRAVGRACAPRLAKSTKLFSRNRLDFGSQDHAEHEFGLNGHMGGLAPQADTYVLVTVAYLLARRRGSRGRVCHTIKSARPSRCRGRQVQACA